MITAYGSVRKAMEATKGAGAFHVVEKPFEPDEVLGLVKNALEHRKLVVENTELRRRLVEQTADSEILGSAPGIQRVMETIASVADTDANVLIVGESGTGKELIANALHERSARRDGPWIKINCAALPKDLIESELFGHTKGVVHRRHHREDRPAGGGAQGLAPARRDHRDAGRPAGQAAARAGGARGPPPGRRQVDPGRLPAALVHQPQPRAGGEGRAAPPGPLLPHQHRDHRGAAAARAARGPPGARARVPRSLSRQAPAPGGGHRARGLSPA